MIKKFKNGKLLLKPDKFYDYDNDQTVSENFYHNDMSIADLSYNQINGYLYLVDFNKRIVYQPFNSPFANYSYMENELLHLLRELTDKGKLYLYPYSKKDSKSFLQDLENGY